MAQSAAQCIGAIQFGILSPEEIRRMSVIQDPTNPERVGLTEPVTYENNQPKRFGLCDLRLGPTDRHYQCETCRGKIRECPGHSGHIELNRQVFHPGFIRYIQKVLQCVCFYCSAMLLPPRSQRILNAQRIENKQQRLRAVSNACSKVQRCRMPECAARQPKITLQRQTMCLSARFPMPTGGSTNFGTSRFILSPEKARTILQRISDTDCVALGLDPQWCRPEWMVLEALHVPPPCVRPSVVTDSARGEDDLTRKLVEIIKANNDIVSFEENVRLTYKEDEENLQILQFHVALYFDNECYGKPLGMQRGGTSIKTLKERLKGKEGRFRANLNGKRAEFCARCVISPDPSLDINEIRLPLYVCQILTYPETVTAFNFERLYALVRRGPHAYPGARYVIKKPKDGTVRLLGDVAETLDLRYCDDPTRVALEYGDVVERHLVDGDVVLFNRQPSLHKMSVMAHRVRVSFRARTFGFNPCVTPPYNADYDGDEMNIHVPQTEMARAEALELMLVEKQIITPQSNKPVLGPVQNVLLGISFFTTRDCFLTRAQAMDLVLSLDGMNGITVDALPPPAVFAPKMLWTGKQLLSLLLPDTLSLHTVANMHPKTMPRDDPSTPLDTLVCIQRGELLTGRLCKKTAGISDGGLIHITFLDYGPTACRELISGMNYLANRWLPVQGYSIGIGDAVCKPAIKEQVKTILDTAIQDVEQLWAMRGTTSTDKLEHKTNLRLNRALDQAADVTQTNLDWRNNIRRMTDVPSKGNKLNITQMMTCVAQQNVEGKRIEAGFNQRTTPHFAKEDRGALSGGFIESSYVGGLTPLEFFFHSMAGREGLIDTAVKTAKSGYIQRRLMKAHEDIMVHYDGTVRNSLGNIIQYVYGEDGVEGTHIEFQAARLGALTTAEFDARYRWPEAIRQRDSAGWLNAENALLTVARGRMQHAMLERNDDRLPLPIGLKRMIERFQDDARYKTAPPMTDPTLVVRRFQAFCRTLRVLPLQIGDGKAREAFQEMNRSATQLFIAHLLGYLASKPAIEYYRFSATCYDAVLLAIGRRFRTALVQPGEMVGPVAAQSIVQPATQMTLNTFHYTGIASKNQTSGLPRFEELIKVSKTTKTPSMVIFTTGQHTTPYESAVALANTLEHTSLADLVACTEIIFDPDPLTTDSVVESDRDTVQTYYMLPDEPLEQLELASYVLRLTLRRDRLIDKALSLQEIQSRIRVFLRTAMKDQLFVVFTSDQNDAVPFVRIRPAKSKKSSKQSRKRSATSTPSGRSRKRRKRNDGDAVDTSGDEAEPVQDEAVTILEAAIDALAAPTVSMKGVPRVIEAEVREARVSAIDGGEVVSRMEYVVDTLGSNLEAIWQHALVDVRRTCSNEIIETLQTLGIEACRNVLYKELERVLSFDYINYRHLALLIDVMTHRGYLMSMSRHGLNQMGTGPLKRASFEETYDMLLQAAMFAELDELKGISENIMTGNLAPMGTGFIDMLPPRTEPKARAPVPYIRPQLIAPPEDDSGAEIVLHDPFLDDDEADDDAPDDTDDEDEEDEEDDEEEEDEPEDDDYFTDYQESDDEGGGVDDDDDF